MGNDEFSFDKFFASRKSIFIGSVMTRDFFFSSKHTIHSSRFGYLTGLFALLFAGYASFVILRSVVIFANRNRKWETTNLTETD